MKNYSRIFVVSLMTVMMCGGLFAEKSFTVEDVSAHQRYPWNGKVDIDFKITCEDTNAEFEVSVGCTDHSGNTNITMKTVRYGNSKDSAKSFLLKAGEHRLVWDGDADIPNKSFSSISFAVFAKLKEESEAAEYLVIDLSGGPTATKYPVTTINSIPSGGWTDEYKLTKLVLRRCSAGTDPLGRYVLTKDFYAGIFEVTEKQWDLVMGVYDYGSHSSYPVCTLINYDKIRGSSSGSEWPASSAVDSDSFMGKLRAKTGILELDLPTEAQWEYACRAGTTTTYNTGNSKSALENSGWYKENSSGPRLVGGKAPNSWGLYDMHGNVREWCLDWWGKELSGTDPIGGTSRLYRVQRGGSYSDSDEAATSSYRLLREGPSDKSYRCGFRVFRTIP